MTADTSNKMIMTRKKKNKSATQRRLIPSYIFLTIVSFISVFPLYWMVSAATNISVDVARGKISLGAYAISNFMKLITGQNLAKAMGNSFLCWPLVELLFGFLPLNPLHLLQEKLCVLMNLLRGFDSSRLENC